MKTPTLPRTKLALAGALAATAWLCPWAATQAQTVTLGARSGASVQPLPGVNLGPRPIGEAGNVELTSACPQRGVTQVRTHDNHGPLDMTTLYPNRSKDPLQSSPYNFSGVLDSVSQRSSDRVFASIPGGGFEPCSRVGDSHSNVTPPRISAPAKSSVASPAGWGEVASHCVQVAWVCAHEQPGRASEAAARGINRRVCVGQASAPL